MGERRRGAWVSAAGRAAAGGAAGPWRLIGDPGSHHGPFGI
jgi:hypothetical protein